MNSMSREYGTIIIVYICIVMLLQYNMYIMLTIMDCMYINFNKLCKTTFIVLATISLV